MPTQGKAWKQPSRGSAAWQKIKRCVHIARRSVVNFLIGPRQIPFGDSWIDAPIIAEYRSPLWSGDREDEFELRCGKVQNLRIATRLIHGLELQTGDVFSFWTQIGRPTRRRGFVDGREIMSGCVVPTVGGGICQLTNALARCAQQVGLEFIEHHRHSALVEGQNPHDLLIDATTAWNHIDFRLRSKTPLRLEAFLTHDELVLRIRQPAPQKKPLSRQTPIIPLTTTPSRPVARGCLTCEETTCFRHRAGPRQSLARTALLLDVKTPEFEKWIHSHIDNADWMIPWHRMSRRHLAWDPLNSQSTYMALAPSLRRTIALRMAVGEGGKLQAARQRSVQWLAHAYARQLKPEHTELVIAQELLVPLWREGVLGGRTFRVLASQLPMSEIQTRLDLALRIHPQASELQDFRAPNDWSDIEWMALSAAQMVITPHSEIVRCLRNKSISVEQLDWVQPQETPDPAKRNVARRHPTLCLAASALPRKGSIEVAAIAKSLDAQVLILGSPPTELSAWQGVKWRQVGYTGNWLEQADVVLLPAFIEHQPRALLQARANGIPVVATAECGLSRLSGINWVAAGDADGLEKTVRHILGL